jgi:uncharacterized metal-binding protein YceD (DUF177 family)
VTPEFPRLVPLARLGPVPFEQEIAATPEECAALASRFGLLGLDRLAARVALEQRPGGTVLLTAEIEAAFIQECVVSLEPVPGTLAERFALQYGPPEAEPANADESADEPAFEPLAGDSIDIGEAVAQEFSLFLPPFPRAPGAVMEEGDAAEEESPFAVLARLKQPPESA